MLTAKMKPVHAADRSKAPAVRAPSRSWTMLAVAGKMCSGEEVATMMSSRSRGGVSVRSSARRGPGRAQQVARHLFGRGDGNAVGKLAEDRLDCRGLAGIVEPRARAVGVDVVDLSGGQPGVGQGEGHAGGGAGSVFERRRHVVRVVGRPVACDFGKDRGSPRGGGGEGPPGGWRGARSPDAA